MTTPSTSVKRSTKTSIQKETWVKFKDERILTDTSALKLAVNQLFPEIHVFFMTIGQQNDTELRLT